jgi:hypothetical protein
MVDAILNIIVSTMYAAQFHGYAEFLFNINKGIK